MPRTRKPIPDASTRARVVGRPGRSTTSQYREAVAAYRKIPLKWVAVGFVLALGVVGAGAFSIGADPLRTILAFGGLLLAADLASRFPSVAATIAVVAASSVFSAPFAGLYAAAAAGPGADFSGAVATLMVTLALTGLLAHRTSRGRPWVTTLLVAVAVMFVGPFFLVLAPWMGFAWAWTVMAVILFLRGGGWAWLVDQGTELSDVLARRRDKDPSLLPETVQDLEAKRSAEMLTADLLADLPAGYTVFHDRRLPNGVLLNHLVVGPAGVFLVDSEKFRGRITEHPQQGLVHPTVPVGNLLNDADTAAALAGARLRLKGVRVNPVVVIHGAVLPATRARVALSSGGDTLGVVTVLAPHTLLGEVSNGPEVLSERQVRRVVARLDRVCPPAAGKHAKKDGVASVPVQVIVLDEDGNPKTGGSDAAASPMFVSSTSNLVVEVGQPVTVLTDQGTFSGYRVAGHPQPNDEGIVYVPLAHGDGALVTDTWFPLDSIQPVQNAGA